jgi:hypothetical protein
MDAPHIPFTIMDQRNNITFVIWAYRQLEKNEAMQMVTVFLRSLRKKPKKNSRHDILTVIH